MSFSLYSLGTLALIAFVAYVCYLAHLPQQWIAGVAFSFLVAGFLGAALTSTRLRTSAVDSVDL